MRDLGNRTAVAIEVAKQASPGSDGGGNERATLAAATTRSDVRERNIDEICACLTEQIRLLATVPEFDNKARISNCAQVSLMLIKQLRCAPARGGEAEIR